MPYLIAKNTDATIRNNNTIPSTLVGENGKFGTIAANQDLFSPAVISSGIFTPLLALKDELAVGVVTTEILVFSTPSSRGLTCTSTSLSCSDSSIKLAGVIFTITPKSSG